MHNICRIEMDFSGRKCARGIGVLLLGLLPWRAMGVEPFWTQNTDAIFTSSSMSVHASEALGAPTFAAATWCQNPQPDNSSYGPDIFVETWDLSDVSGNSSWRFHETQISIGTAFQVTMARHAVSSDALAVDLVALESHDFFRYANGSLSPCDAFGFKSRGDGTPAWHFHITNCTNQAILDSLDMGVTMSDDGSLAVFQALLLPANSSGDQSDVPGNNTLVGLDGQTGALRWQITLPIDPHSYIGSVSASAGGNWAAWWVLYATHPIWIVDGVTGAVRATIDSTADWAGVQISDSGDFVVLADDQNVTVLQWDSSAGAYVVQRAFQAPPPLPSKGGNWVCQATAMSSDGSGTATGEGFESCLRQYLRFLLVTPDLLSFSQANLSPSAVTTTTPARLVFSSCRSSAASSSRTGSAPCRLGTKLMLARCALMRATRVLRFGATMETSRRWWYWTRMLVLLPTRSSPTLARAQCTPAKSCAMLLRLMRRTMSYLRASVGSTRPQTMAAAAATHTPSAWMSMFEPMPVQLEDRPL